MAEVDYTEPAQKTSLILTTFGVAGPSTLIGDTLNIPIYAAGITGADEGLTLNGSLVELGYPGVGPAAGVFTENRIIGLGTWDLGFYNGVCNFLIEDPTQAPMGFPTDAGAPTGHEIIRVDFFNTLNDLVPWRLSTLETDNGDGTFDHIIIYGFNHSHADDLALPGWIDSSEYHYLTHNYERHIQVQAYGSERRLMSYTYLFNGPAFANDTCLIFISGTSWAFRTLDTQFESLFHTPGDAATTGQFGFQNDTFSIGYIEKANVALAKMSLQNTSTTPATNYEFLSWNAIYFMAIGPRSLWADPSDFSFHADGVWVSNPANNTFFIDNASTLDMQINFQPSRNIWNMKVSNITAEWADTIPTPNGYSRTFYWGGNQMLSLSKTIALFSIPIQTPNPTGGVSAAVPLQVGNVVAAAVVLDAANYVEINIGGVLKKLALVN